MNEPHKFDVYGNRTYYYRADDPAIVRALAIAAVVDDQGDEVGNAIGDAIFAANGRLEGWAACKAIVTLAEARILLD